METINYLDLIPGSKIAKFSKKQVDGVWFTGYPRAHPTEKSKIILVNDPLGIEPAVLEFCLDDIIYAEEMPSAVTEHGEGVPLIKLWIKHGAIGMILQPFEVKESESRSYATNTPAQLAGKIKMLNNLLVSW